MKGHEGSQTSNLKSQPSVIRCAIYTRKSTEEGLDQAFNSLDAQREAAEHYIASQKDAGWICLPEHYDDGGFTGANLERPALRRLFRDVEAGSVDCIVVHRVDRLSRSLLDFARIMEVLDRKGVSFVSTSQPFNTTNSIGRLTLNVLLSFAQFEREIIAERTRDKIRAARRKGKWTGGIPILGYDVDLSGGRLVVNEDEAGRVQDIFRLYVAQESLISTIRELRGRGWTTKSWVTKKGKRKIGNYFDKVSLCRLLRNPVYAGKIPCNGELHPGEHQAIIDPDLWERTQSLLQRHGGVHERAPRVHYGALLSGILYCTSCQSLMVHTHTSKQRVMRYRYYICSKVQKQGWDTCPTKSVSAPEIEKWVVDRIRAIGRDPGLIAQTLVEARKETEWILRDLEADRKSLDREIRDLATEIKGLMREVGRSGNTQTPAAQKLGATQDRLREAEQKLTIVKEGISAHGKTLIDETEVASALREFDALWAVLPYKDKARLVHLLIERVGYDREKGKASIVFNPTGIKSLAEQDGSRPREVAR